MYIHQGVFPSLCHILVYMNSRDLLKLKSVISMALMYHFMKLLYQCSYFTPLLPKFVISSAETDNWKVVFLLNF